MTLPWKRNWGTAQQEEEDPYTIQGPPREPPPQSASDAAIDRNRAAATALDPAQAAAQLRNAQDQPQNTRFQQETELRTKFEAAPPTLSYRTIIQPYVSAIRAADNQAGDLQLIYAFGKIMDPGSVVREGEMDMVRGTGGISQQLQGYIAGVQGQGRLRPEVRQQLLGEIRRRASAAADSYNQVRGQYGKLAESYGFDPANIIGEHPGQPHQQAEADWMGRPVRNLDGSQGVAPRSAEDPRYGLQGDFGAPPAPPPTSPYYEDWNRRNLEAWRSFNGAFQSGAPVGDLLTLSEQLLGQKHTPEWTAKIQAAVRDRQRGIPVEFKPAPIQKPPTDADRIKAERDQMEGPATGGDLALSGAMLSLGDEGAGVANALRNTITAPFMADRDFDPLGAYSAGKEADQMRLQEVRDRLRWAGTAIEVSGELASGNPTAAFRAAPRLFGRMAQGGKAGAAVGGIAGAGSGDGLQDRVTRGVIGMTGGAAGGSAVPLLGAAGSRAWNAARTATGRSPNLAINTVSQAIADDANTPGIIGRQMQEAQGRGTPYMIADSGDNVRALLASSARAPGPSRTVARDALQQRQEGLTDRVTGAIERDLGPVSNPHQVGEDLMQQASTKAAPLFEAAYARPNADTFASKIAPLLSRPSMKRAMERAERLAREEGDSLEDFGFVLNGRGALVLERAPKGSILAGEMVPRLGRRPSWKTMDYIKRGMDDVVESYRDPTSGRLNLDEEGRAINGTLRSFLSMADRANPQWAKARAAWAGPVRAKSAMETGRKALSMSADDMAHISRDMTPSELEFFRLGVRRSMSEAISARGDSSDTVHALIGTPKKRAMLSRLFGGKQNFDRFVTTLRDEQAGFQTYKRAFLGSPTAPNLTDDAYLNDASIGMGIDLATGGGVSIANLLREGAKFGAGRAGSHAREEIATLLSETDPAKLTELARQLYKAAAKARKSRMGQGARAVAGGRVAGAASGNRR